MIYFWSTLPAWGSGKHMETWTLLQGGGREEHLVQPQLRAGRGVGRSSKQQAGLFMSSRRDENIAKEFVKNIQNYIFQYKVSHLESKGQHTEWESWRTQLLMSRQNWNGQTKMKELGQGHHGRSGVEVRGVLPNFCPFNSCTSQNVSAPWVPWLLRWRRPRGTW